MLSTTIRRRAIRSLSTSFARPYASTHKPNTNKPRHTPGWREDLATTSEASVKADHDTATMDEMKQKTVDAAQSHHPDPEAEPTHATYARDQVDGPLGNAGVGEFEGVVGNDDLGPDHAQVESNGRLVRRLVHEKKTAHQGDPGPGQANV